MHEHPSFPEINTSWSKHIAFAITVTYSLHIVFQLAAFLHYLYWGKQAALTSSLFSKLSFL